jgi:PKD repeat protein
MLAPFIINGFKKIRLLPLLWCWGIFFGSAHTAFSQTCTSSFTYQVDDFVIYFTNTSTANGDLKYYWNFGDGNFSNRKDPVHAFTNAGKYAVCMMAVDAANNCSDVYCDSIQIDVQSPGCKSNFGNYDQAGDTISFFNISTGVDTATSYFWSFGDGGTATEENPTHIFKKAGEFNVCLQINNSNCADTICKKVKKLPKYICESAFEYSVSIDTVKFTHRVLNPQATFFWTFGDNETSTDSNPVHIYKKNSRFQVCLQVSDTQSGCWDLKCDTVVLKDVACAKAKATYTIDSLTVSFSNLSAGDHLVYYVWDFGDGKTSFQENPTHAYKNYGLYHCSFYVADTNFACSNKTYFDVTIDRPKEYYDISGKITADNFFLDYGKVILARVDQVSNAVSVAAVYRLKLEDKGNYSFKLIPKGKYYIKAVPDSNSILYKKYLPTYLAGGTFWKESQLLSVEMDITWADVVLNPAKILKGSSRVQGSLIYTPEVPIKGGKPCEGYSVLLLDMAMNPLQYAVTGKDGTYEIKGIEDGFYLVQGEAIGRQSNAWQVNIQQTYDTIAHVNFMVNQSSIFPENSLSVSAPLGNVPLSIYPNPTNGFIYIDIEEHSIHSLSYEVSLFSISGSLLNQFHYNSNSIQLSLENYPSGIYYIAVHQSNGGISRTKVVKY